ncbi:hypothetical protein SmJEL517_g02366 [Synchytrium microbalum]|uniref:Succinylglutamate desuccinylase/Aspartoacylase catalytic domain-containing protein n=1 Tax=Synchytrium microbalum TaxID=1806994 RepID=A0A507CB18_9FUNG|nr:uncharacterized protein SmJEL517_g02366 [Synchytrium microbalum]TPX35144.1 hypothetical protein SmJEL517_g02366 [Synchytrium microbalum]
MSGNTPPKAIGPVAPQHLTNSPRNPGQMRDKEAPPALSLPGSALPIASILPSLSGSAPTRSGSIAKDINASHAKPPSSSNAPKIRVFSSTDYKSMAWKNGLGETTEIAIRPEGRDCKRDDFLWRLSMSEVKDTCSFSVFPNYDIGLVILPEDGMTAQKALVNPPALLHHNDHETAVVLRPLIPYTYNGEVPTTCHVRTPPLRHLTILAHRKRTLVTVNLETICPHGFSNEGGCSAGGHGSPTAYAASPDGADLPPLEGGSPPRLAASKKPAALSKILLGNFTIVYVIRGAINVQIDGDGQARTVNQGETLICERTDDSVPTDFAMTPIASPPTSASAFDATSAAAVQQSRNYGQAGLGIEGVTKVTSSVDEAEFLDATVAIFQINIIKDRGDATPIQTPGSASTSNTSMMRNPFRRKGSIIVYDDQPSWSMESGFFPMPGDPGSPLLTTYGSLANMSNSQTSMIDLSQANAANNYNLAVKYWDSARHYRPPSMSARYVNESDVPPPVIRDTLDIEEFPVGKISTVWINMMKQGLSEWLRVPVIVARGTEDGPVVGITAAIHGNELNGVPCIHRVITDIDVHRLRGTVVAVPCVNVVGYLRFTREFSDGKDLNRLFPGSPTGTASTIYVHNLMTKIIHRFEYLIDLHTASFGRVNSYYVRSDMNDPVSATLAKLQQPQIILHNSGQDGTLRSAAMTLGIKAITVEIGNPQLFQNQYVQWSYMGVMRILGYLSMFTPDPPEPNPMPPSTVICSKGFWIYTKTGGVLEVYPGVNTFVKKGDLIARIKNIFGNIVDEIYATSTGITIGRSSNPVAMAGDRILHMGVIRKENELLPKEAKENCEYMKW